MGRVEQWVRGCVGGWVSVQTGACCECNIGWFDRWLVDKVGQRLGIGQVGGWLASGKIGMDKVG